MFIRYLTGDINYFNGIYIYCKLHPGKLTWTMDKTTTWRCTLQETNISPKNGILKMMFLFPRWDMLIPWRVSPIKTWWFSNQVNTIIIPSLKLPALPWNLMVGRCIAFPFRMAVTFRGVHWLLVYQRVFLYGCFRKWWYPTTMGFPTKNDQFGVFC